MAQYPQSELTRPRGLNKELVYVFTKLVNVLIPTTQDIHKDVKSILKALLHDKLMGEFGTTVNSEVNWSCLEDDEHNNIIFALSSTTEILHAVIHKSQILLRYGEHAHQINTTPLGIQVTLFTDSEKERSVVLSARKNSTDVLKPLYNKGEIKCN